MSHSTIQNETLYDIEYEDGDSEQMDITDILKYISPHQPDTTAHTPEMHERLRMATPSDRARIKSGLFGATLKATKPISKRIKITRPTSKLLLRKSTRARLPPNRLTSTTMGQTTNSNTVPLLIKTSGRNKANHTMLRQSSPAETWKRSRRGNNSTVYVNATTQQHQRLQPNSIIRGIHVHCFAPTSPPVPQVPARDIPPPTSFEDAIFGPYAAHWRPAYQKEINSLFKYGVWELQRLPRGAMRLPCKIVFRVKPDGRDPPGIDKFKVRYCGKGFLQKKGASPLPQHVCTSGSLRLVTSIANELDWPLHGMDVSNAYLNAPDVVLFVKPPPTVFVPKGWGLRLLKGLYGTMQGGNRWAHHKHQSLTKLGMVRNPADPSLYHRHDEFGIVLMDVVVDDFKITGWPPTAVARIKSQLRALWDMTDLGPIRYFSNVEIQRDRATRRTTLKQTQYIHDMLARYDLQDCYPKHTPCTKSIYDQRLLDPVMPYKNSADDAKLVPWATCASLDQTCVSVWVWRPSSLKLVDTARCTSEHYETSCTTQVIRPTMDSYFHLRVNHQLSPGISSDMLTQTGQTAKHLTDLVQGGLFVSTETLSVSAASCNPP